VVVLTAVAGLVLLGPGTPAAQAHAQLVATSPGQDAAVAAPGRVILEFSDPPLDLGAQVVVLGPDGTSASRGAVEVRGTLVVQQLAPEQRSDGIHTVQWRVVPADGHPLSGSFRFTVTGTASGGSTQDPPASEADAGAGPGDTAVAEVTGGSPTGGLPVLGPLTGGALAIAGGLVLARRLRGRP